MISFKTSSKNWGLCKRSLQRQEKTMEDPARQEMWRDLWRRSVASQCTVSPPPASRKWQTKYNSNQSVWRVQRRKNIPKNNDRWNHRVEYGKKTTTHTCWLLRRWLLSQNCLSGGKWEGWGKSGCDTALIATMCVCWCASCVHCFAHFTYVCICPCLRLYDFMRVCVCVHICLCVFCNVHNWHTYMCVCVHICLCMCVCVLCSMHIWHTFVCVCACVYVCVCAAVVLHWLHPAAAVSPNLT